MLPVSTDGGDLFTGIPIPSSASFVALCAFCDEHAAAIRASLPWLAAEIDFNDGHAAMLRFVRHWSGTKLYVAGEHSRFVEKAGFALGSATYLSLVERIGAGSQVEVPSAWGVFMALRRVAIAEAIRIGTPEREIAHRFGITLRSLR